MLEALKDTLSFENTAEETMNTQFLLGDVHLYENKVFWLFPVRGGNVSLAASSTLAFPCVTLCQRGSWVR